MEATNYLSDFERLEKELAQSGTPGIHRLRKAAISRFAELGFPGARDEEWRFINLAPILQTPFEIAGEESETDDGLAVPQPDGPGTYLLCRDGSRPLVRQEGAPLPAGVIVCSLAEAMAEFPDRIEPYLGRLADSRTQAFAALNTAFLRDGAFIWVPKNTVVEAPIHVNFVASANGRPLVWHRRCLVVAGANSKVRIAESYDGPLGPAYFTNAVTEIALGENAQVDHYKLVREGDEAYHVGLMHIHLERGGNFSSHAITLGGALVRNEANAVLDGEGCTCTLNGLYLGTGRQLIDNHTMIDHARPHCVSHELYKGILDGKSRGVFNGKIFVRQDAQKTDAKQTNQTLLLSDDATINTKPQLEIYADDVKCTHGATVGQLDAESLFYLRTRGIGHAEARALLTYAFANDIIHRIAIDAIRARLEQTLLEAQHLPADDQTPERS
jgi:Fe-S cluster assembly protein SufD